jgi:hypothetical protein
MANKRGRLKGLVPIIQDPTKQASQPCKYPAGSPERITAYRQRVERGEQLFHPGDDWQVQCVSLASRPKECSIRQISLRQMFA